MNTETKTKQNKKSFRHSSLMLMSLFFFISSWEFFFLFFVFLLFSPGNGILLDLEIHVDYQGVKKTKKNNREI